MIFIFFYEQEGNVPQIECYIFLAKDEVLRELYLIYMFSNAAVKN